VNLPTDARRLIDPLAGTLNDFAGPICPESIRLRPMLGVYHPAAAELPGFEPNVECRGMRQPRRR
jgi:hypothetical protein